MKKKLTLSIDADLMETINQRAKLNRDINLSKMVEQFLRDNFENRKEQELSVFADMRGILKDTPETRDWKKEKEERLIKKYLND